MNLELYQQFLFLKDRRKKDEARQALAEFIASFQSMEEKAAWVHAFLSDRDEQRIRHEIYVHLVFPVLLEGYKRQDPWSLVSLARTIHNIYKSMDALHAQIDHKSKFQLLKEAYLLEPSPETKQLLLKTDIEGYAYCQHEWPAGILYGANGASIEECDELLREIVFTRSLDDTSLYATYLDDFEQKVHTYRRRLIDLRTNRRLEEGA